MWGLGLGGFGFGLALGSPHQEMIVLDPPSPVSHIGLELY